MLMVLFRPGMLLVVLPTSTPSSVIFRMTEFITSSPTGLFEDLSATSSTPTNSPLPRTSPTHSWSANSRRWS